VSLRAGVTEVPLFESYDDDNTFDLGQLDADCGVFSPREESRVLYSDLIKEPDVWS
jgi:hypothetical protein